MNKIEGRWESQAVFLHGKWGVYLTVQHVKLEGRWEHICSARGVVL